MTDEERQRAVDFIVAQQAKFSVDIEELKESQIRADGRTARLERIAGLMIKAGLRARRQWREMDERFEQRFETLLESQAQTDKRLDALREAQVHSDKRLDALIDIIRQQHNGSA